MNRSHVDKRRKGMNKSVYLRNKGDVFDLFRRSYDRNRSNTSLYCEGIHFHSYLTYIYTGVRRQGLYNVYMLTSTLLLRSIHGVGIEYDTTSKHLATLHPYTVFPSPPLTLYTSYLHKRTQFAWLLQSLLDMTTLIICKSYGAYSNTNVCSSFARKVKVLGRKSQSVYPPPRSEEINKGPYSPR